MIDNIGLKYPHISTPYKNNLKTVSNTQTIFWGEVKSIDDEYDGGRIKVYIPEFDNKSNSDNDIPYSYPINGKFFHVYPQVGELVRVFIEDIKTPNESRYYTSSIISQLHKIKYESRLSSLSTTNLGHSQPDKGISKIPSAKGVFPAMDEIGIIGRENTDIILGSNYIELRSGKHIADNILSLNKKNPASVTLTFEKNKKNNEYESSDVLLADKIALISHSGDIKFKSHKLSSVDRDKIFEQGHPLMRGDLTVEILDLMRSILLQHVHGYSGIPADIDQLVAKLQLMDFDKLLQKNIVIN